MGIVKKQSIEYTLIYYFGIGLGYLNTVILFPKILEPDEFGLTRILLSISIVIGQFSQLGSRGMIIRYYTFLKERIFSLALLICTGGLIFLLSLMWFLKVPITNLYIDNSSLFVDHFLLIIPFAVAITYFNLFDSYLKAIYKSIFSTFLSNILLRIIWTIIIILYSLEIINFPTFIILYSCSYGAITIISFVYLQVYERVSLSLNFDDKDKHFFKQISSFNTFTALAGLSAFLINKVDIIMLGSMKNLEVLGVYAIAAYMAMVIRVPASSIGITAQVITADAFKKNDLKSISRLYQKTSITQLILSGAIFILIASNFQSITFSLKDGYEDSFRIFFFLGLAQVIDSSMGINGAIMINSKYYRIETFFSILLLVLTVASNYLLIPTYGGNGAALATLLSIFIYNSFRLIYIQVKLRMNPFNSCTILGVGICILVFVVAHLIPQMDNFIIDMILRTAIILFIFIPTVYWAKLSPDINEIINHTLTSIKKIF